MVPPSGIVEDLVPVDRGGRMIHELRAYDLKPGSGPDYLAMFVRQGMGAVTRSSS